MSHGRLDARTDSWEHVRICLSVRACNRNTQLFLKLIIADVTALLRPVLAVSWGGASSVPMIRIDGREWTRQLLMSRRLIP